MEYENGFHSLRLSARDTDDLVTFALKELSYINIAHLMLCLANATHNIKCVKTTDIVSNLRLNVAVQTNISL